MLAGYLPGHAAFLAAADPAEREALWRGLLDRPEPAEAWVACDDGQVVGFAGVRAVPTAEPATNLLDSDPGYPFPPSSGALELWGLYLLASHQGLGLGRRLLDAALDQRAASLWAAADNARAIGFYGRFGFVADGVEGQIADWENLREIRMVRATQQ